MNSHLVNQILPPPTLDDCWPCLCHETELTSFNIFDIYILNMKSATIFTTAIPTTTPIRSDNPHREICQMCQWQYRSSVSRTTPCSRSPSGEIPVHVHDRGGREMRCIKRLLSTLRSGTLGRTDFPNGGRSSWVPQVKS